MSTVLLLIVYYGFVNREKRFSVSGLLERAIRFKP